MVTIQYKKLRDFSVIYLIIPILIFFFGWLDILFSILFSIGLLIAAVFYFRSYDEKSCKKTSIQIAKNKIILIAAISLLWCFFAGQGGFIHQSWDHLTRNIIIKDLVRLDWPVAYHDNTDMLCYYIAHWMVPASVGKMAYLLSGSLKAGYLVCNIVLFLWSSIGCFLTLSLFVLLTDSQKKARVLLPILIFILFSGADFLSYTGELPNHLEWWANSFQFSSNSTCLFWVYNQAIAAWIATLCVINENSVKNLAFIGLLSFPYSPIPFIGLVFICLVKGIVILVDEIKHKRILPFVFQVFSFQNIFAVLTVGVAFALYFSSNMAISEGASLSVGFRFHDDYVNAFMSKRGLLFLGLCGQYIRFVIIEFGLLAIGLHAYMRKDYTYRFAIGSLFLIPLFQIGQGYDFSMRASIPALVYLCFAAASFIQQELPDKEYYRDALTNIKKKPIRYILLIVILVLPFVTEIGNMEVLGFTGKLIIPLAVFVLAYGLMWLIKRFPRMKLPFKVSAPKLKPAFVLTVAILILGTVTPFTEFVRETKETIDYGTVFYYDKYESLEEQENLINFFAVNYKESDFYKYICKK